MFFIRNVLGFSVVMVCDIVIKGSPFNVEGYVRVTNIWIEDVTSWFKTSYSCDV